ncbi:MAG: vitamin K epoxide reductase family protein [Solirubrobacteraceae bacterium]|nr:vitamin K epoxide reductase family protein [Solirubrobacteraceae bacterium]
MDRIDRRLLLLIRLVLIPGFIAATYLSYTKLFNAPIMCTGGCDAVQTSKWSEVFGIPVVYIGSIAYTTIFVSTFIKGDAGKMLGAFTACCGAAFSIFLQYQSLVVLEHLCPYCLTSAICMQFLAILTVTRVIRLPKFDAYDDDFSDGEAAKTGAPTTA